jgi:hypothetical protein
MEEYLHNFKGIAKGRGLPPRNPMECEFFGILLSQVYIDLGGIEIGMTEPLLELEGRDTLLRFVGREGVPQGVATGFFGNPRRLGVLHDEFANPPLGNGFALVVYSS